jgi:hypothetical protein
LPGPAPAQVTRALQAVSPGDRERRRVQPRQPRRSRTYLLGLDDELLGVGPLARDADNHEAISGGGFVVAPADGGVDDDFVSD